MNSVKKLSYLMASLLLLVIVTILWILNEIVSGLAKVLNWIAVRLKKVNETLMSKAGITEYELIEDGFEVQKEES